MWKQRRGSGEEKCLDIKDEEDLHSEEEEEDVMDIEIKEEVRMGIQCNVLWNKGWNRLGDLYKVHSMENRNFFFTDHLLQTLK